MSIDKLVPEGEQIRSALYTLLEDAARYRALKQQYTGADFTQPAPNGHGTRAVLIFEWPENKDISKSLDNTVDQLRD